MAELYVFLSWINLQMFVKKPSLLFKLGFFDVESKKTPTHCNCKIYFHWPILQILESKKQF